MRLANSSRTLLPLALSAVLATCAFAQEHPNVNPNAVRGQLAQPSSGAGGSQPQSAPQDSAPSAKEATAAAKAAKKATAKSAAKSAASAKADAKASAEAKDAAKSASATSGNPAAEKPAEDKPLVRRDPFDTLLTKARAGNAPPENLPPGKAGLIVDTLRIGGIVHSPTGMIAIVSNAQQRVYFLREGDKLYDGSVEKIDLDSIAFHEVGKDAFGKPLERTVTKRLNPSPGEQQ
jgi:Tfp pilus assembly protein PilP